MQNTASSFKTRIALPVARITLLSVIVLLWTFPAGSQPIPIIKNYHHTITWANQDKNGNRKITRMEDTWEDGEIGIIETVANYSGSNFTTIASGTITTFTNYAIGRWLNTGVVGFEATTFKGSTMSASTNSLPGNGDFRLGSSGDNEQRIDPGSWTSTFGTGWGNVWKFNASHSWKIINPYTNRSYSVTMVYTGWAGGQNRNIPYVVNLAPGGSADVNPSTSTAADFLGMPVNAIFFNRMLWTDTTPAPVAPVVVSPAPKPTAVTLASSSYQKNGSTRTVHKKILASSKKK